MCYDEFDNLIIIDIYFLKFFKSINNNINFIYLIK